MAAIEYRGIVVHGQKYGRKLGFPTANLDRRQWVRQRLDIRFGIYAGTVTLANGKKYKAGIVIGPVDKKGLPKIEAHIIGYSGSLYGKSISLSIQKFLRLFKPYVSEQMLKQQIQKDIKNINSLKLII